MAPQQLAPGRNWTPLHALSRYVYKGNSKKPTCSKADELAVRQNSQMAAHQAQYFSSDAG